MSILRLIQYRALLLFFLFFFGAFSTVLYAQKKIYFSTISNDFAASQAQSFDFSEKIAYKTCKDNGNLSKRRAILKGNRYSSDVIPIVKPHTAELVISLRIPETLLNRLTTLELTVKTTGAFGDESKKLELKEKDIKRLGASTNEVVFPPFRDAFGSSEIKERGSDLLIPIFGVGSGSVEFEITKLIMGNGESTTGNVDGKSNKFNYEVIEFPNIPPDLADQAKNDYRIIERLADQYDKFVFLLDGKFSECRKCYPEFAKDMERLKNQILLFEEQAFSEAVVNNDCDAVAKYYDVFALKSSSLLQPFSNKALNLVKTFEKQSFRAIKRFDIVALENFYDNFLCGKVPKGYARVYSRESIEKRIKDELGAWSRIKNKTRYCGIFDTLISSSNYYENHQKEDYFKDLGKCNPNLCLGLDAGLERIFNENTLNGRLAEARENNCSTAETKIKARINFVHYLNLLDQARKEDDPSEKIPLLERIIYGEGCPDKIKAEANAIYANYLPPELSVDTFYIVEIDEFNYVQYLVSVKKGKSIEVVAIDGDSTYIENHPVVKYETIVADSIFRFRVRSTVGEDGEEHEITFRSQSGDRQALVLTKRKFRVIAFEDHEEFFFVELENGRPPYWIELIRNDKSFKYKLHTQRDTIQKSDRAFQLAEKGTYEVLIHDSNGNRLPPPEPGEKTVKLNPTAKWQIWQILILPTTLLIGFLFYRNLGTKEE